MYVHKSSAKADDCEHREALAAMKEKRKTQRNG